MSACRPDTRASLSALSDAPPAALSSLHPLLQERGIRLFTCHVRSAGWGETSGGVARLQEGTCLLCTRGRAAVRTRGADACNQLPCSLRCPCRARRCGAARQTCRTPGGTATASSTASRRASRCGVGAAASLASLVHRRRVRPPVCRCGCHSGCFSVARTTLVTSPTTFLNDPTGQPTRRAPMRC